MPIEAEAEEKFSHIAELIAIEASAKLSSVLNRNATISYERIIDSIMTGNKIAVPKDSFLVSTPVEGEGLGPISMVASNKQVFVIADLVMGGDGNANEDVRPDETNQMVFSETINQVFISILERFTKLKEGFALEFGTHDSRVLYSIKEATLGIPETVEDPVGLGFTIKIASKLDAPIHIEINTAFFNFLIEEFEEIASAMDVDRFVAEVNQSYVVEEEEDVAEESGDLEVAAVEEESTDAYEVNEKRNLSFLRDINMDLIVELGRSEMLMKDVLRLTRGSAIELDRLCSEPVDLYVHNQLIARGEVVAIDDSFGLKITKVMGNLNLAKQLGLNLKAPVPSVY